MKLQISPRKKGGELAFGDGAFIIVEASAVPRKGDFIFLPKDALEKKCEEVYGDKLEVEMHEWFYPTGKVQPGIKRYFSLEDAIFCCDIVHSFDNEKHEINIEIGTEWDIQWRGKEAGE